LGTTCQNFNHNNARNGVKRRKKYINQKITHRLFFKYFLGITATVSEDETPSGDNNFDW
jgi:hypothetical protein